MDLNFLKDKLSKETNLRSLKTYNPQAIDFFSNDYFGLSHNADLLKKINQIPKKLGSTGSRLISGNTEKMLEIEYELGQYYNSESGLFFPSGFMANLAFFSTIPSKYDTIIYDQYIHASAREGIRLSYAKNYSFKHNDYEDLEKKINQSSGKIFLALEGIYSMDGDSPNIEIIQNLIQKYNLYLVIDEAHSVGILGENGKGWSENLPSELCFAKIITFGKALGYHGALIAGSELLIQYLINYSKAFIYTTASSESTFITLQVLHHFLTDNIKSLQKSLQNNILYYGKVIDFYTPNSPIQIIQNHNLETIESKLINQNILVKTIKHPTVEKGKERIRICIHSFNTMKEIALLSNTYAQT